MKRFLLSLWLIFPTLCGLGQLNNQAFEDRRAIDPADSGKLHLGINILGFTKDNEYDKYQNPVITGYTLFGYQLNPYLSYQVSSHIRLEGGIYLQKDFGNNRYTTVAPTLSVKYENHGTSVIFGNLEGSLNHRLIEPLYDFERVLNNRLENGLQFKVMRKKLFLDVWIDWNKMIYLNDSTQEELTAGFNLKPRLMKVGNTELTLPWQAVAHHRGGQINFRFGRGDAETLLNSAIGLEIHHTSTGFFKEWRASGYGVYYKSLSGGQFQTFKTGNGTYLNLSADTRWGLILMASYWQGNGFVTAEGGKIYPSVSVLTGATHRNMNLLIFRLMYDLKIQDGVHAGARLEPYYDFDYKSLQTAFGVYLNFRERFFLLKRRTP